VFETWFNKNDMKHPPPLEYDTYYHIYNRGINGETLFREPANFEHFLRLYEAYITPVAETFSWVLMKNHFHLLVRIHSAEEIGFIIPREDKKHILYPQKKKYNPTQQFGNLFNAYTRAFNNRYGRTGSLLESPFRRLPVKHERYFKQLVFYIHNNPIHHGFCKDISDYPWSSWLTILSVKKTSLQRDKVIGWFNSRSEFVEFHLNKQDLRSVEGVMIE
jgi:REP element-mobilizing transposase RayT